MSKREARELRRYADAILLRQDAYVGLGAPPRLYCWVMPLKCGRYFSDCSPLHAALLFDLAACIAEDEDVLG